jgi:hypothetical protein
MGALPADEDPVPVDGPNDANPPFDFFRLGQPMAMVPFNPDNAPAEGPMPDADGWG